MAFAAVAFGACSPVPTETASQRSTKPVLVDASRAYTRVAAGFVHSCALSADGVALCWGNNDYSQLGSETSLESCGGRPCSRQPIAVSGNLRFTTIAAGWVRNCGVSTDGGTYCWGGGSVSKQGYLGDGQLRLSATPVRVVADSSFVALTIGDDHACALTASGMAFCWGQNTWGQLGDGSDRDRATPVAVMTQLRFRTLSAGAYHTCGITSSNDAYCWGDNRWGELGLGAVPYNSVSQSIKAPALVTGNLKFREIAAGWEHTCAIAVSGVTHCWGRNEDARQLGDESEVTHRGEPAPIAGGLAFATLSAGALSTCGHTATLELHCWGANYYGGLGNGEIVATGIGRPVRTLGGPFAHVAIGQSHACAISSDRRLWCWGDQSAGQF